MHACMCICMSIVSVLCCNVVIVVPPVLEGPRVRQVLCFCCGERSIVCTWQGPKGSLDEQAGYTIRFAGSRVISKEKDEFSHVVLPRDISGLGATNEITVEVCAMFPCPTNHSSTH